MIHAGDYIEFECGRLDRNWRSECYRGTCMKKKSRVKNTTSVLNKDKLKELASLLKRDPAKALEQTQRLLSSHPQHVLLLILASDAARLCKQKEMAISYAEQALVREPDSLSGLLARALVETENQNYTNALPFLERAEANHPDDENVIGLLALCLIALKKYDELSRRSERIEKFCFQTASGLQNYANALLDTGRLADALAAFERSIAMEPDNPVPYINKIVALHYSPNHTAEDILKECKGFQKRFSPKGKILRAHVSDLSPDKTLRIGMISDGFRRHPVGSMITLALAHIPKEEIEFFAYATNTHQDDITRKIKNICTKWEDVKDLSPEELDRLIRSDKVDILIDLSGFNTNSRVRAVMMEPAPIIVKWVGGLISSTGLDAMDYLISDKVETPLGADELYTEKLIRLPNDYICFDAPSYTPPLNDLPAERNGYVTFGCFNNAAKINDILLERWAGILNAVPKSQLFLKSHGYSSKEFCERIHDFFARLGIEKNRIRLEGPAPHRELLDCYNDVDIALDPWPYSGGLTTCEALLMGVPVITLPGPTFAGRHSATHLVNAGLPELVADDWDRYHQLAVSLANDLDNLATIRQNLRFILLQSPLCDAERFGRGFSNAMRAIWQRHCAGKAPEALVLSDDLTPYFADESGPVELLLPKQASEGLSVAPKVTTKAPDTESAFCFELSGRIITVDNGTNLATKDQFSQLRATDAFQFILFDPGGVVDKERSSIGADPLIQLLPFHVLGDGEKTTLYASIDPERSSTLKPISPLTAQLDAASVVAEIPVFTVSADCSAKLTRIDWLMLSGRHAISSIVSRETTSICEALLVQVNLPVKQEYFGQASFDTILAQMESVGFDLYRVDGATHYDFLDKEIRRANNIISTRILELALLFVPSRSRLRGLAPEKLEKLAFIAHTAYGLYDFSYYVLSLNSVDRARRYLEKLEGGSNSTAFGLHSSSGLSNRHELPARLVVSLTSYSRRFSTLHLTLRSLLSQTVKPDRLLLWIANEDFPSLPKEVTELIPLGVEIKGCEDIRSFKKFVPTLRVESDAFLVTADDDICYPVQWLEKLIETWSGDYDEVVAWRAHKIRLRGPGEPAPYADWKWNYLNGKDKSSLIFPTSGGGVLYPPGAFHPDVMDENLFMNLCPTADDVWLYWMCAINDKKFRVVGEPFDLRVWSGSQESSLWELNKDGGNDRQFYNVLRHYGKEAKSILESAHTAITAQERSDTVIEYKGTLVYFHLPEKRDHIQNILRASKKFYELEMLEDIAKRSNRGEVIVDVGANIGNHSVFFGLFCSEVKVLAFEPQERVYKVLRTNIIANDLDRKVRCYQMGIGQTHGRASLGAVDPRNLGMTKLDLSTVGSVSIMTLDSLVDSEKIEGRISIMKIDVEGMELDVLKGAYKTICEHRPLMYIEAAQNEDLQKIEAFLSPLGYGAEARFNATATYLFAPHT